MKLVVLNHILIFCLVERGNEFDDSFCVFNILLHCNVLIECIKN